MISTDYPVAVSGLAFGGDTVALLAGKYLSLAVARIAPDGAVVTPAHEILSSPGGEWTTHGFVRRGPDVIAAPLTEGFELARLSP